MSSTDSEAHLTRKFLLWTFIPSYLLGFVYYQQAGKSAEFSSSGIALSILIIYMWLPTLAVIIVRYPHLRTAFSQYGVSFNPNRYWLGGWLFPLFIVLLTIFITLIFGWGRLDLNFTEYLHSLTPLLDQQQLAHLQQQLEQNGAPLHLLIIIFQAFTLGATINALAAFGEELGWRGLLWHRLRYLGFWKANLLIGLIWGLWHAPLIAAGYNFPLHPYAGIFVMIIATLTLSPLIGYIRERSGSVIACSIFHGVFNAMAGIPILIIADTSNIIRSPLGLAGIIGMLLLIAVSYVLLGLGRTNTGRTKI